MQLIQTMILDGSREQIAFQVFLIHTWRISANTVPEGRQRLFPLPMEIRFARKPIEWTRNILGYHRLSHISICVIIMSITLPNRVKQGCFCPLFPVTLVSRLILSIMQSLWKSILRKISFSRQPGQPINTFFLNRETRMHLEYFCQIFEWKL